MRIDAERAAEILKAQDDILILTHKSPDGDTLGCGFSLCRALMKCGKRVRVECSDDIPKKYNYLFEDIKAESFEPKFVVAVDIADTKLIGGELEKRYGGCVDLCIDHHGSNIFYAKDTCLDADAAAAAEIIYKVIRALGAEIDTETASCIYTGLSTDTGCFRYSNTTAATHRIAADMIDAGARASEIDCIMFETKPMSTFVLQQLCLESMELHFNGRCALITLTRDMIEKSGADESDGDFISSIPRQVEGVSVGVTLKEKPDGTFKASVRTHAPADAARICAKLNGGGHKRAAGCEIKLELAQAKELMLKSVEEELNEIYRG